MLGFCDSEVVCAPAGEASITPKTASSLRRARRIIDPRCAETNASHPYKLIRALRGQSSLAWSGLRPHRLTSTVLAWAYGL